MTASTVARVCPLCGHVSPSPGEVLWRFSGERNEFDVDGQTVALPELRGTGWRGPDGHQCGDGQTEAELSRTG